MTHSIQFIISVYQIAKATTTHCINYMSMPILDIYLGTEALKRIGWWNARIVTGVVACSIPCPRPKIIFPPASGCQASPNRTPAFYRRGVAVRLYNLATFCRILEPSTESGTWPAFWTLRNGDLIIHQSEIIPVMQLGEIDVIKGVHGNDHSQVA